MAAAAWAVVLVAAALVRGRLSLARDILASAVVAVAVALLAGAVAGDGAWHVLTDLADIDGPPDFPPGLLTLATAAISSASPHLTRPYRHLGRWLIAAQFAGAMFLGATFASGGIAAIAVGLLASAGVHLVFGSPGGGRSVSRVRLALGGLGVSRPRPLRCIVKQAGLFEGSTASSTTARRCGSRCTGATRDGQLVSTLWRRCGTGRPGVDPPGPVEQVEHEAFLTLLAGESGVVTDRVIAAGPRRGDAVVVRRRRAATLAEASPAMSMIRGRCTRCGRCSPGCTGRASSMARSTRPDRRGRPRWDRAPRLPRRRGHARNRRPASDRRAQLLAMSLLLAGADPALDPRPTASVTTASRRCCPTCSGRR